MSAANFSLGTVVAQNVFVLISICISEFHHLKDAVYGYDYWAMAYLRSYLLNGWCQTDKS